MAARDRYSYKVNCTGCKTKGEVFVSENDYPFMARIDREVDKVEGPFWARETANEKVVVTCIKCGKEVDN